MTKAGKGTEKVDYTNILIKGSGAKWKHILDVQRPYRWNLNRLNLGRTLDIGCGVGRNLNNLPVGSIGIDHNEHSIKIARDSGLVAFTVKEFKKNKKDFSERSFDSMILTHVLEHMDSRQGAKIIKEYLPYVKHRVVVIVPQELGFKSDKTHVNFLRHKDVETILVDCGLRIVKSYSFPFPKQTGKVFKYNETVVVAEI